MTKQTKPVATDAELKVDPTSGIVTTPDPMPIAVPAVVPVGRDTDGAVKPLADLSYAPQAGWNGPPPDAELAAAVELSPTERAAIVAPSTDPTAEPSPLEVMQAQGQWEWRLTDGILTVKRSADVQQAAEIVRKHFAITPDKWRQMVTDGVVQVKDTDDGTIYSGKGLARILGFGGGNAGTPTPA